MLVAGVPFVIRRSSFLCAIFYLLFLCQFCSYRVTSGCTIVSFVSFYPTIIIVAVGGARIRILSSEVQGRLFHQLL